MVWSEETVGVSQCLTMCVCSFWVLQVPGSSVRRGGTHIPGPDLRRHLSPQPRERHGRVPGSVAQRAGPRLAPKPDPTGNLKLAT